MREEEGVCEGGVEAAEGLRHVRHMRHMRHMRHVRHLRHVRHERGRTSWLLSVYVMVASRRTEPPSAWLTVQISKPSLLPRSRRLCWRVSRDVPERITEV